MRGLGNLRGVFGLGLIAVFGLGACDAGKATDDELDSAGELSMVVVSGDDQEAAPGEELPEPVVVRVQSNGRVVSNQIVNWRVVGGNGTVYAGVSMTNRNGEARERWTLGENGEQVLEARAVHPTTGAAQAFGRFTARIRTTGPAAPVATVAVSPSTGSLNVGQTQQLTVTLRDAQGNTLTGRALSFSSSNAAVASVTSGGLVGGVAPGSATITVTSEGRTGTAQFTVVSTAPAPVATVVVTPSSASVQVGQTTTLAAQTRDSNGNVLTGRAVTWSSSNTSIATVSSSGVVTGRAAGSATITATSEGRSGTSSVTVTSAPTPPPPPSSGSVLFSSDWTTSTGSSLTATRDGGKWDETFCSNANRPVEVIRGSDVGFNLTTNVLRTTEMTEQDCFKVQENVTGTPGQDYYVRAYIRNDVTRSSTGSIITWHPFVVYVPQPQFVFWSNQGGPSGQYQWQIRAYHSSTSNANDHQWGGFLPLRTWHRFEWHVQYVNVRSNDADVRVWPRVYDMNGNLVADANTLRRTWTSSTQTLAQWYAAGNYFRFPRLADSRKIGLGTEGPAGAQNTRLPWYYAGFAVGTSWLGPIQ